MPSQMHGKNFENMMKSANAGIFSHAASDRKRSPHDRFDINAEDDLARGIPTSIKSSGGDIVALSDAGKFWESFEFAPYRMLVGSYRQESEKKVFHIIHEIILREKYRAKLLGSVSQAEVNAFHNGLKIFERGKHKDAQAWHRKRNKELEKKRGLVRLNPKVDSKTQRRLQCSIKLSSLIDILDANDHITHTRNFGTIPLPLPIISGRRSF